MENKAIKVVVFSYYNIKENLQEIINNKKSGYQDCYRITSI